MTHQIPSRRHFLAAGATTVAALALSNPLTAPAGAVTSSGCRAGSCATGTSWMLATDWTEPRGPHGKTRLESRASRTAAANRLARSEAEALDMNLHLCSWAPAVEVPVCASQLDSAFAAYGRTWQNPWNGSQVSLVDRRWLPADFDVFTCPASTPAGSGLAVTGVSSRRLLFTGIAATLTGGVVLRLRSRAARSPGDQSPR